MKLLNSNKTAHCVGQKIFTTVYVYNFLGDITVQNFKKWSTLLKLYTKVQQRQPCSHTYARLTALSSGTNWVSQYQKGKTNLDFNEARESEWQWHQLASVILQLKGNAKTTADL